MAICNTAPYMTGGMGEFSDADFVTHYTATCGMAPTAPYNTTLTGAHCRSEHLCNAVRTPAQAALHCTHANAESTCPAT
jgi:hypothetical protein